MNKTLLYIKAFFTEGNQRSVKAKKNIAGSAAIKGMGIAISLVLVPLTLHYINPTQYGIWITLSSIIGWFGFFDIGFGNGLRNKFTECVAKGEHKQARIYVSTTYAMLSIIIAIVLILFFFINPFLNWSKILNTPSEMESELGLLALIVFVFFCLRFVLQLIHVIITANQKPAKASLLNFFGSLFSLFFIFILTKTTAGNLIYLGTVISVTPILVLAVSSIWLYKHEYRKYAPSFKYINLSYAKNLMNLGLKFFFIQIASIIFYQTSNIIIAQLYGPALVTPYNIAFKYFSIIPMFFGIILTPFWSAFTDAWSRKDYGWIKNIMNKLKLFWLLLVGIVFVMFMFSNSIYKVWVGKDIIVPLNLTATMAFYTIINTWNGIYSHFLNGVGKIKLQLYLALFGSVLNIPLAVYFGKELGIYGVILATSIISLVSAAITPIQYYKIINNKAHGIWAK